MNRPIRTMILGNVNLGYSWLVVGSTQGAYLNGHNVRCVDMNQSSFEFIKKHLYWFKPDILITHLTFHKGTERTHGRDRVMQLFSDVRKKIGTKICHHLGDARAVPRYIGSLKDCFDIALINNFDPKVLANFINVWQIPAMWWPYAALTQKAIADPTPTYEYKLVYTGNMNAEHSLYSKRTKFLMDLSKIYGVTIFRTQEDGDLRHQTAELAASSEAIVSLPADNDLHGYIDVRPFQYGGAGALLLQRVNPGLEHVFDVENHMVGFYGYSAPEAVERFEQVVETAEDWRRRSELFNYVQAEHTYERRIRNLVEFFYG